MPSYEPPQEVADVARRALELRSSLPPSRRAGTDVGIARAAQLANRRPVSIEVIARMVSFFARHAIDKQADSWSDPESKARQAWGLWGGDPGRAWAERIWGEQSRRGSYSAAADQNGDES